MTNPIAIAGRAIRPDNPPYLIAEIGINHGGDPDMAEALIRAAAGAGAHAAKLQVYRTEEFLARSSPYFQVLADAALSRESVARLVSVAAEENVVLFASVFDEASADLMHELRTPAFKIASGDLTHLPLLRHVARLDRPMVVSTGGATLGEVATAVETIRQVNRELPLALLHCVSNYPARPEDTNLLCMDTLRRCFHLPVGFSDHTQGNATAMAAVALGAEIIEKHFTLNRKAGGPDHALSADAEGLAALARDMSLVWAARGQAEKAPVEPADVIPQFRRSLTAARDIPSQTSITAADLAVKRPGTGISPSNFDQVVGRKATQTIAMDTPLTWDLLA